MSGGKLTAEQVREAIERNFGKVAVLDDGKPVEWRDDWVCKIGVDYRAIADELNAAMGGGERYEKLFGTPEKAARTLYEFDQHTSCWSCSFKDVCGDEGTGCIYERNHDALLEWLRGDVE